MLLQSDLYLQPRRAVGRAELRPRQLPAPRGALLAAAEYLRLLPQPAWRRLAPHPRQPLPAPPPPASPRPDLAGVGVPELQPRKPPAQSPAPPPRVPESSPSLSLPGWEKLAPAQRAPRRRGALVPPRQGVCGSGSGGSSASRGTLPGPQWAVLPGTARPGSCCPSFLLQCRQRPAMGEVSKNQRERQSS